MIKDLRKYVILMLVLIIIACTVIIIENIAITTVVVNDDQAILNINFLFPMKNVALEEYIAVEGEYSNSDYQYSYNWIDSNELVLIIQEIEYPKGQRVDIEIKDLPTRLIFDKCYEYMVQFECKPQLIDIQPKKVVPTIGPITLIFNTLMDQNSLERNINTGFEYEIYPSEYYDKDGKVTDYSTWQLYPSVALQENQEYNITLNNIESLSGEKMTEQSEFSFITAIKPQILNVDIDEGFFSASIYPKIEIQSDATIKKGRVQFQSVTGKVTIDDNIMTFLPDEVLKEKTDYKMIIQVMNKDGEWSQEKEYSFKTMSIKEDQLWVEVALGDQQEVIVKKGHDIIRTMTCSGGLKDSPTVTGTYYLKNRGEEFFSQRFNEGAKYWVRIVDQYLFHGIPFDENRNTIQEELDKIGEPASHGCVRLLDEDAKWFYENVPHDTMVIIHE